MRAFTLIGLLLMGCSTPEFVTVPPKQHAAQKELLNTRVPLPSAEDERMPLIPTWVPCDDQEKPSMVFVAELTIPKLFEPRIFHFPLCRKSVQPGSYWGLDNMELADGVSPKGCGIGYGGSLHIVSIEDDAITVDVIYYWTDIDCDKGEIDSSFVAHFGKRETFALSPTIRVDTYFTSTVPGGSSD